MIHKSEHKLFEEFPIDEVARILPPGMNIPSSLEFSPDDSLVTYLFSPQNNLVNQLYGFEVKTGARSLLVTGGDLADIEEKFTLEESLHRERMRQVTLGVTSYHQAKNNLRMIIPLQGKIFAKDWPDAPLKRIFDSQNGPILGPELSPDGQWIAFVQDAEIFVLPFEGGHARQVTSGARGSGKTHGLAEFIAEEEMDRHEGFWWSPDSRWIAFTEVDDTHIPHYRIIHQGKDKTGAAAEEDHAYPFAGQPNAKVRLGMVAAQGGDPVWMDLGNDPDIYLARVNWLPDDSLTAQILNRRQDRLELLHFNLTNGTTKRILVEESKVWINLHDMFWPLKNEKAFIWASERSGFRHLYLYDFDGNLLQTLTQGEWVVDGIAGVDEGQRLVYFTATANGPTESHLYTVPLQGGQPHRITAEPGMHAVVLDHAGQFFVDTFSDLHHPRRVLLRALSDGSTVHRIYDELDPRLETIQLRAPEIVTLLNRSGITLYGSIYRPDAGRFGNGPYPTIIYVYGGPHAQLVTNSWNLTSAMRAQYLRGLGYLVFVLDNRGSDRRGLAFEAVVKHNMGHPEVDDQVDGVRWLVERGLADPHRVGIYGWSYGGYMAAMGLARAPETFKVAVAGAPVTDWDGYDTCYTERYMGMPQDNPAQYNASSVISHVNNIQGKLMLVHGLIDENVHFRHTARLINALIRARKHYELLLFPDERHLPRRLEDRVFMEENIRDFFLENL